ncbi:hypothetical protein ISN41_13060 [Enterobacter bugandensis]|uniref:hypothetical protein n=1 Tax=Enterobacter bugandensis TaxID=881260 RepID=UPI0018885F1D|nr:hypothetical protein [Enterobacter bugandensis]MBF2749015.1 hypothetical protein [Enterobacter bugandensis]MBF2802338.1 hypothetical protein [Enterobacter bugandensis]
MRDPISIERAEYKSAMAASLWEVILEKANEECSPQLIDLLCMACDINHEIHQALAAELGMGGDSEKRT